MNGGIFDFKKSFRKVITNFKTKFYGEKLCQTKVHLLIRHIGYAGTLVPSTKILYGVKPRK